MCKMSAALASQDDSLHSGFRSAVDGGAIWHGASGMLMSFSTPVSA
jgi:hypothetical protein